MIKAVLRGPALLKNIMASANTSDRLHLWWLGQSGFLIQWNSHHILVDPYLSDSLTRKYEDSDRPHVRMTEIPVDPHMLDFIDVVTSSHSHMDHLDPETLKPLLKVNPSVDLVIPEANRQLVAECLECPEDFPLGLDDGVSVNLGEIAITGIAAAHEELERDDEDRCRYLGYVIRIGPWTIYHAGDSLVYEGLAAKLQTSAVDLAILPINGRDPARGVAGNMTGVEAASLAYSLDARLAVPCHFEMFEFNTVSPLEFEQECRRLRQSFRVLRCGERWSDRELEDADASLDEMVGGRWLDDMDEY